MPEKAQCMLKEMFKLPLAFKGWLVRYTHRYWTEFAFNCPYGTAALSEGNFDQSCRDRHYTAFQLAVCGQIIALGPWGGGCKFTPSFSPFL